MTRDRQALPGESGSRAHRASSRLYVHLMVGVSAAFGSIANAQIGLYCPTSSATQRSFDAVAVSNNGVVIGSLVNDLGQRPSYTWSLAAGLEPQLFRDPKAISADGTTVVGGDLSNAGYIWTRSQGIQGIPYNGFDRVRPRGVSGDGSVVTGFIENPNHQFENQMFRWSPGGTVTLLGQGEGMAITPDASVIAGTLTGPVPNPPRAFRYTSSGGTMPLGVVPGYPGTQAMAISADGSTIVGNLQGPAGWKRPFRWTASTGMVSLGDPGGLNRTYAHGTNGDGSMVVGTTDSSPGPGEAFLWDQTRGMRLLKDVLVNDCNIDMTGWRLWGATAISADGRYIVGVGEYVVGGVVQGNAFVAVIPAPSALTIGAVTFMGFGLRRRRCRA